MEILFMIAVALGLYFLPTIVGWNKRNAGAIFVLNFLLGWTLIGWVVAMVWAFTYDTPNTYVNSAYNTPKPAQNTVDEIVKLTSLREKGSITEAEYQKAKDKILNS